MLTGFQPPTSGEITLSGRRLSEWTGDALSRKRAVMRQRSGMAFSWAVEDVIAMGRAPWPEKETTSVVQEVMALTGCDTLAGRDFCQLSGGEQQRVQLARALAQLWLDGQPHGWLFLDEPTSALDLYHQQHILRLLRRLSLMGTLSVCVVLHDLNLAALWADRIVLLHEGSWWQTVRRNKCWTSPRYSAGIRQIYGCSIILNTRCLRFGYSSDTGRFLARTTHFQPFSPVRRALG